MTKDKTSVDELAGRVCHEMIANLRHNVGEQKKRLAESRPRKRKHPKGYSHTTTEDVRNCIEGVCWCDERRIVELERLVRKLRAKLGENGRVIQSAKDSQKE